MIPVHGEVCGGGHVSNVYECIYCMLLLLSVASCDLASTATDLKCAAVTLSLSLFIFY